MACGRLGVGLHHGGRGRQLDAPFLPGSTFGIRRRRHRGAIHHAGMVDRCGERGRAWRVPQPRRADFTPLRHDPFHRVRSHVLRGMVLGLFLHRPVSERHPSGDARRFPRARMAAEGDPNL